jgi:hypothetical protein
MGRRRFVSKGGFATGRESGGALNKALVGRDEGTLVAPSARRLGEYLAGWVEGASADLKPTTAAGYRRAVAHLARQVGQVKLQELTPLVIEQCDARLLKSRLARRPRGALGGEGARSSPPGQVALTRSSGVAEVTELADQASIRCGLLSSGEQSQSFGSARSESVGGGPLLTTAA